MADYLNLDSTMHTPILYPGPELLYHTPAVSLQLKHTGRERLAEECYGALYLKNTGKLRGRVHPTYLSFTRPELGKKSEWI